MSTKLETLEEREHYYRDRAIQKVIAYHCRYREITVIKHLEDKDMALRPFKIFKPEHFRWLYDRLHLDKVEFDIYISNASVRLPPLPSRPEELKKAREILNKTWMQRLTGFDYFVDIDAKSPEDESQMIDWAKQIIQKIGEKMQVWTTGSGGVHILQLGQYSPDYIKNQIMDICCELDLPLRQPVKMINNKKHIPHNGRWIKVKDEKQIPVIKKSFVDNLIYDYRRIRRVPFSIHSSYGIPMKRVI